MPTLIYCAGGNPLFCQIALSAGFRYGARLPSTTYAPLYFADQEYRRPDRVAYMRALARHRPAMATVIDWERADQLPEVLDWAEEAAEWAGRVVIIPKVQGEIGRLPHRIGAADIVLGFSVPTRYGGTCLPVWEFTGWPVHLLGGSPHKQYRYWRYLRNVADVVSTDGNQSNREAHYCRFWSLAKGPNGHWRQLSEIETTLTRVDANALAFSLSCSNIAAAWKGWAV
jgi:hypothetical protein